MSTATEAPPAEAPTEPEAAEPTPPEEAPPAQPERPAPTNVIAALARVMEELPGIGKGDTSEQGYSYRGIEAITKEAQHLLGKHCVVFVPKVVRREVKDLTINNRPWTEDQAEILYTVYGPGGVDDKIEVGPLWGLGRDNSDKGMNKAMTQAFKYALIQTLCIGDSKDDADAGPAHEADAKQAPPDPDKEVRSQLRQRIAALPPEQREEIRNFCDEHKIPRVTSKMDDDQLEAVTAKLDAMTIAGEQDRAAEAPDAPSAAEEAPQPAQEGEETSPAPEPASEPQEPAEAPKEGEQPEEAPQEPTDIHGATEEQVNAVIETVKALDARGVDKELTRLRQHSEGHINDRRRRLGVALLHEAMHGGPPPEQIP